jgi:hypothetical protein
MDLDETWYGLYAIGDYPKIALFSYRYPQSVLPIWQRNELVRWDQHQPMGVGSIVGQQWDSTTQKWVPWFKPIVGKQWEPTTVIVGTLCCVTMGPGITLEQEQS